MPPGIGDLEAALRLFDETTRALEARSRRLEEVITVKQAELVEANRALENKVAELARLQAWTSLVLASVPSGVLAIANDGRITTCNPAAARLLGVAEGDDYRTRFPGSPLLPALAGGEPPARYERRVAAGDGVRILACHARAIRDADRSVGVVEAFEDVTEVRELQDRVARAERLKALGEMAAGVAHEIRNPLNGIDGFATLLLRDLADERPRRYAQAIVDGVRHLNRTVTGLLEYTRPRTPDRRLTCPVALARSCLELVQAEHADDDHAPAWELAGTWHDGHDASLDPTQIRQVLLNLLQNAAQALAGREDATHPGRVRLSVDAEGTDLVFTIDDDGPGIPEADRARIFTPFYTTRAEGTGLGLSVCHAIADLHGGAIAVSDSPLGGARFTLRLPAR